MLFTWLYLNLLRIVSIIAMKQYMGQAGASDVLAALYYGSRMSLKTAGVLMLLTFVFVTLVNIFVKKKGTAARLALAGIFYFITDFLFVAKFFYYKEFHTNFNEMVFNAAGNDDVSALLHTFIEQYHLIEGTIGVLVFTAVIIFILKKYLMHDFLHLREPRCFGRIWFKILTVLLLALFALFVRFGGSFSYAGSIHWENCAKTQDTFLNEMILDDMQALYRGRSIKKRIDNGVIYGVNKDKITQYVQEAAQHSDAASLGKADPAQIDANLIYHAQGAKIEKPRRIFIVIGESFAQWPLLDEYADLHLGDNMRALMTEPNSAHTEHFLPNGAFTPMAVNAVISGLSDVNIYPNHQLESYRQVYATALAPQLKKLGYKTQFWYSGFSGWERIKDFALAQGFDEFHCASDYSYPHGNVWGCDDEFLFEQLQNKVAADSEPTAYVILSVSNHAPYSVDVKAAGFPADEVRAKLPAEVQGNDDLLNRLGHYWYTDKVIGTLVHSVESAHSGENLFMITGDHADRTNIEAQPELFERYTIPFIVYGAGITKDMIPADAAGGHINIGATLMELIAPKGFEYYSLGPSLTRGSSAGFNDSIWINADSIGRIDGSEPGGIKAQIEIDRTISWWRTMKGNSTQDK